MERKLASIQKVINIESIPNADAIEVATVLGWKCVVKKGEFKPGDLCVYFEIDSFLPVREEFEFLRKSSFRTMGDRDGFRLRTIKLRGQVSQGLILPISTFNLDSFDIGHDLTELLKVLKWDPPIPASLRGLIKGNFPGFLIKTDETRIQSIPDILEEIKNLPYFITTKLDGTSATYYFKDEFGVCGRNMEYKPESTNTYWQVAIEQDIENKLKSINFPICVQGEICGPGIQKNPLRLNKHNFFVYNVFDIKNNTYFKFDDFKKFCADLKLETVPIEEEGKEFPYKSIEELLIRAQGKYNSGVKKEGIVIRDKENNYSNILNGRMSFKVINNDYLLKVED